MSCVIALGLDEKSGGTRTRMLCMSALPESVKHPVERGHLLVDMGTVITL